MFTKKEFWVHKLFTRGMDLGDSTVNKYEQDTLVAHSCIKLHCYSSDLRTLYEMMVGNLASNKLQCYI